MNLKLLFVIFCNLALLNSWSQVVLPSFTSTDSICVNTPFTITNTSTGATDYFWSFCSANLKSTDPETENLGNFSGSFNQPVFMDYVLVNNNYYGFVTNYRGGNLIRLDFGNSLLNTPIPVNLGNFDGILSSDVGSEGIQVVQNEGKWYAIIVSGYPPSGSTPRVVKIAFGTNITNPAPVATNWGNIGNMYQPIDLHLFQENNIWYGFTVNAENNTITRFNFTNSFENTPTGDNLGNIGNLEYPTGMYAINDNGNWKIFITNSGDRTRTGGFFTLTRLDFGSSLLNPPTGVNLGNIGNMLGHPRDITIMRSCNDIIGFVVNGHPNYNNIIKLDFNNNLNATPTAVTLPNQGFDFPHSISKLFRVNETVYGFITDAETNTLSRIKLSGCNNASIPSSSLRDPPQISYNAPGIYNINLTVDIGLPTQSSFCKQVVVVNCYDSILRTNDTTVCSGTPLTLQTAPAVSYQWTPALYLDDATSATPVSTPMENIKYYVDATIVSNNITSIIRDSITITVQKAFIKANEDTTICSGSQVQLLVAQGAFFTWSPSTGLSNSGLPNPVATPLTTTPYEVIGIDPGGCLAKDTVVITVLPSPSVFASDDTLVCRDQPVQISATGGSNYQWTPSTGLNDPTIANPIATTPIDRMYKVRVIGSNNCSNEDSVQVSIKPFPEFLASANEFVCEGAPVLLNASGGELYQWSAAAQITDPNAASTVSIPTTSTIYTVNISEGTCGYDTIIELPVTVNPKPVIAAIKSNDINCNVPTAQLEATGGTNYTWFPAAGLNNAAIATPVAAIETSTTYEVTGTNEFGCSSTATISIDVDKGGIPRFILPNSFSPNGDGKNDCFGIQRWGSTTVRQFSIYNRWGQLIFKTIGSSHCWDGTYNGKPQNAGTYIYIINANTICGEVVRKGTLTLVR